MAQTRSTHRGFTLVEMLVVIAIIGTLAGLLLPAVMSARSNAQRMACISNVKQLTLAARNFETSQGRFPGYQEVVAKSVAGPLDANNVPRGRKATWVIALFPYLEQQPLYDEWNQYDSATIPSKPHLELLVCPSDEDRSDLPALSYIGNAGQGAMFPPPANQPKEIQPEGLLFDHYDDDNSYDDFDNKAIRIASDGIKDGASNTILFAESLHIAREECMQGGAVPCNLWLTAEHVDGSVPGSPPPHVPNVDIEQKHYTVFVWHPTGNQVRQPGGLVDPSNTGDLIVPTIATYGDEAARPSSSHPANVITVGFAGGEAFSIRPDIDYLTYKQLMASHDKGVRGRDQSPTAVNLNDARPVSAADYKY